MNSSQMSYKSRQSLKYVTYEMEEWLALCHDPKGKAMID
jgi:hypothetical protein